MKQVLSHTLDRFAAYGRGLLIHHWDADGISAGALVEEYFAEQGFTPPIRFTPPIGNYFFTPADIAWMKKQKPAFIISCDICLDARDVRLLKTVTKRIVIVDHHYQPRHPGVTMINPVTDGVPTNEAPSASWVVCEQLWPKEVKPLGVLGMVGDQQEDIRHFHPYYDLVKQVARAQRMSVQDLITVTERLHAIYVTNRRDAVMRSLTMVRRYQYNLRRIIDNKTLKSYQARIVREVARLKRVEPIIMDAEKVVFHFASKYHLIAEITRYFAALYPKRTVITAMPHPSNPGLTSVYFRTKRSDLDMGCIVQFARSQKYNAGGKLEVAGVLVPTKQLGKFLHAAIPLVQTAPRTTQKTRR